MDLVSLRLNFSTLRSRSRFASLMRLTASGQDWPAARIATYLSIADVAAAMLDRNNVSSSAAMANSWCSSDKSVAIDSAKANSLSGDFGTSNVFISSPFEAALLPLLLTKRDEIGE